jgi:hypothetical protein
MINLQSVGSPGPEILLEVLPAAASGDLAPRVAVPEEFKLRAAEIADGIAEVVDQFQSGLGKVLHQRDDSSWHVGSIEITFEIAVRAETGVVIAKASAGATFSARVVLQPSSDQPQ